MKRKLLAIMLALLLTVSFAACGTDEETTLSGMVVSIDGTVITLMETDGNMQGAEFAQGEMPSMPSGMEDFQAFESFDPEAFDGSFPQGGDFSPQDGGEMPQLPEGMTIPQDGEFPENGERPNFGGGQGGMGFDFESFASDMETTTVDIGDAHISIQIDGGKASGSLEDIAPGTFVTVTLNSKGEAINVLISSQSRFGGSRAPQN